MELFREQQCYLISKAPMEGEGVMQEVTVSQVVAKQIRKVAAAAAVILKRDGFFFPSERITMHCILLQYARKALRCHSLAKPEAGNLNGQRSCGRRFIQSPGICLLVFYVFFML